MADSREFSTTVRLNSKDAENQLQALQKRLSEARAERDKLLAAGGKSSELNKEIKQIEESMKQLRTSSQHVDHVLHNLSTSSVKELRGAMAQLKKQMASGEVKRGSAEWQELQGKLRAVKAELQSINNESKVAQPMLTQQASGLNGIFGNILESVKGKFGSVGQSILGGFDGILGGMQGSWMKFAGWIGAGVMALKGTIDAGRWFVNYSLDIEEAQRLTREFLGLSGDELTHVQSQISAVADAMGAEYKDVLGTVDLLVGHFGITADEAIAKIKDGIQAGGDLNGTLLQQINQFGPAARDAGNSVDELVAMIVQTRSGVFNEEGMAMVQTASNRLRIMSSATAKALDAIGISSEEMKEKLASGQMEMSEAVQQVSARLMELPQNSQAVGEAMKDVFGKTAANEGMAMVDAIANMDTNLEGLKGTTGEYGELQRQQIDAQAELNEKFETMFAVGKTGFTEMIAKAKLYATKALIAIIDYTRKIINWFIDLYNKSASVRMNIAVLGLAFKSIWNNAKLAFNLIIDGFKNMVKTFKGFGNIIKGVLTLDGDLISQGIEQVFNVKPYLKEMATDIQGFYRDQGKAAAAAWNQTFHGQLDMLPDTWGGGGTSGSSVMGGGGASGGGGDEAPAPSGGGSGSRGGRGGRGGGRNGGGGSNTNPWKAEVDAAKKAADDELRILTARYAEGQMLYRDYLNQQNDLQMKSLDDRMAILEKYGQKDKEEYNKLAAEKREIQAKHNAQITELNAKELDKEYNRNKQALKYQELDEYALTEAQFRLHIDYLQRKQALYERTSQQWADLQVQIDDAMTDRQYQLQDEYHKRLDALKQEYFKKTAAEMQATELNALDVVHQQGLLSEEEYQKARAAIILKYFGSEDSPEEQASKTIKELVEKAKKAAGEETQGDESLAGGIYGISAAIRQQQAVNDELKRLRDEDAISDEEYNAAKAEMSRQTFASIMANAQAAYEGINQIMEAASAYAQAVSTYETEKITRDYEKQIEAAGNNSRKREQLEKERDEKIRIAKTKASKRAMVMELAQATVSTAMAAINAYQSAAAIPVVGHILAPIAAAAALAAGALQIATIKKQHQTEQMGYAGGGYTGRGRRDEVAGVVHRGEWVAPQQLLANPVTAGVISMLEQARLGNTVAALNPGSFGMVAPVAAQAARPVVNVTASDEGLRGSVAGLNEAVDAFRAMAENGIETYVVIDGPDGLDAKYRHYKRLKSV